MLPLGEVDDADDSYYPIKGRETIWPRDVAEQTCDLIKLLNETEVEHGLPLSVADIRKNLYCH